jgi:hypothetical protein
MPFQVPSFPLLCDVWEGPFLTKSLFLEDVPCNLSVGRTVKPVPQPGNRSGPWTLGTVAQLLVPAGTDLRDFANGPTLYYAEVPKGSECWYYVNGVYDIGKGFDNEHRAAFIDKVFEGCLMEVLEQDEFTGYFWPAPIP